MKTIMFFANTILTTLLICFVSFPGRSNPVKNVFVLASEHILMNPNEHATLNEKNNLRCVTQEYQIKDVIFLENQDLILTINNFTVRASKYRKMESKLLVCLQKISCAEKFSYLKSEYSIFPNNSAIIGKDLVPEKDYELNGDVLLTCSPHYEDGEDPHPERYLQGVSTVFVVIGSIISIIALIAHLCTFAYLPSLRDLSGFSQGSLSVSLLLTYVFVLLGLIPDINHGFCITSAVLQQYFILVVYFWMNLISFDIWKTLKKATDFLIFIPSKELPKHFIWYSVYAWGFPLIPTIISVIGDNVEGFHPGFKPEYGKDDICWIGNSFAKAIFFALPSFALFMIDCSLLLIGACMITSHGMKKTNDDCKLIVKVNYFLYVRLAIMLGVVWLIAIIALIKEKAVLWLIADIFGSLQGLFLLIIFMYSKQIMKQISDKRNTKKVSISRQPISEKNSNVSADTKDESQF